MRKRGVIGNNSLRAAPRCRCEAAQVQPGIGHWALRLLLIALLATMVLAIPVRAQGAGVLQGLVVNGTDGGAEIGAGISVNLYTFGGELEEEVLTAETDAEGRYLFEGLDTSAAVQYWVEAVYQDVAYGSQDMLQFATGESTLEVDVTVYETTGDDAGVQLGLVHIFAESFGEVLRISETHLFGSTADRTYVGTENEEGLFETALIPVPAEAVGFAVGEGFAEDRFLSVSEGLVDTEPVRPGDLMSEVRFSYHVISSTDPIVLERRFAYPVTSLSVLVARPGLVLSSPQLQSMGTQLIQDQQYEIFTGQSPDPATPVELEFTIVADAGSGLDASGMPSSQASSGGASVGSQGVLLWIGVLLAAASVAGVFVYTATTGRPAARRRTAPSLSSSPKGRRLVAELADLEDALEAGEVDEAGYERQRAEIIAELKAL